jgi:hydrogenase maturation protease
MPELEAMRILVLGIGNLLLADEGVGVHLVHALIAQGGLEGVMVLDAGTAILDALADIAGADRLIVVDAMIAGGKPGSIYRLPLEECAKKNYIASMHGFDLSSLLALSCKEGPLNVSVIGVEPARIAWGMELSPEVSAVMPELIRIVKEEAKVLSAGSFVEH